MCDDGCLPRECECCGCCGRFDGVVIASLIIGLLLLVILLPLSLHRCDFDEVCLSYDKVSRELGTDVREAGLYDVGPSGSFIRWKKTQRTINISGVDALTNDAIVTTMNVSMQYKIHKDKLRNLIEEWYDQDNFESFLRILMTATVRDTTSTVLARQIFLERGNVQLLIRNALVQKFGNSSSSEGSKVNADVESVQVQDITLPYEVRAALTASTTAQQDNNNALSERPQQVQVAETRVRLADQDAELIRITARRDVAVINQLAENQFLLERARLSERTRAFLNVSAALGRGGVFFVRSYLQYLMMQSSSKTVIGLT